MYRHDASGNAAPLRVIAGSNTGLSAPGQLSEDAQGNLYVVSAPNKILVFAKGAKGNVKPLRVLNVAVTGMYDTVSAMTVDPATGKLYVGTSDLSADATWSTLYRFPPLAFGNEAPFATGSIPFWPRQLANDSTGANLIYKSGPEVLKALTAGVETVAKQFYTNTPPSLLHVIQGFVGSGVADDPTTKTYLATGSIEIPLTPGGFTSGIFRFSEDTTGTFPVAREPYDYPNTISPPPVSIISSATNCGQLALGYLRNIYAVCGNAINVYMHDSAGNAAPLRLLSGSATKLNNPYGIYEGQ